MGRKSKAKKLLKGKKVFDAARNLFSRGVRLFKRFIEGEDINVKYYVVRGKEPGRGFTEANKFNRARGGQRGGYAAWTFKNIMDAHAGPEEIVWEFDLDADYNSITTDPYDYAYLEEFEKAAEEYEKVVDEIMFEIECLTDELIDYELRRDDELADLDDAYEDLEQAYDDLEQGYWDLEIAEMDMDIEGILEALEEIEEALDWIADLEQLISELTEDITFCEEGMIALELEIETLYDEIYALDVEDDCLDWDEVERKAYVYACELAETYIDGDEWIPEEVLDWAYYDVSDHNK